MGVYTSFFVTPMYEATSILYVLSTRDSAINVSDLQLGSELTQDYIKVFRMWEVHEQVISNLDLPYSYSQMQNMLSVSNDADTRMLDITVTSADPEELRRSPTSTRGWPASTSRRRWRRTRRTSCRWR